MFRFLQLALLFSAATAFTTMQPVSLRQPTVCNLVMSDKEVAAILDQAKGCMGEECSVDEVDQLLTLLKATEKDLNSRMKDVVRMIGELDHLNGKEERKPDEIKSFVKDMMSVFSHTKPKFKPTGYSGDIGDGPTTAYDALPPKKWSKPTV
ncbi:unnamed protein product [Cylindrotheca closterium]|uniref:Uncharacterized protein n=1 Tax=Cylindrotheca closterium TaxID=2856 RepID=A0AAD2CL16_9STRA|nr:unnamed protein product [Cylindrotheca closterium]